VLDEKGDQPMGARLTLIAAVALGVAVGWTGAAPAQTGGAEYTIGPGDVLSVSVWRHPELSQQVTVRSNGQATFAPVGDLRAAGSTPTELSRELVQRLRDYMGETTQVSVTVATFNSRTIYLTGQVAAPGRYSFEQIPDLLQLISQAGGPLPGADLSGVTLVRRTAAGPQVIKVDVAAYMRGTGDALPTLQAGDSVDVPSMIGAGGMSGPGLVYVLGEVAQPGPYPSTEGLDVIQAIALAGGTTPEAELRSVGVVMNTTGGQSVAIVDAERVMRDGTATPFLLQAGDRVVVPKATPSIPGAVWAGTTAVLTSVRDVVSAYMLYLTVDRELEDRKLRQLQIDALEAANEAANGQ
jgi:polysaccharide export outer membrane protein